MQDAVAIKVLPGELEHRTGCPSWGRSPSGQLASGREWTPKIRGSPATSGGLAFLLPVVIYSQNQFLLLLKAI